MTVSPGSLVYKVSAKYLVAAGLICLATVLPLTRSMAKYWDSQFFDYALVDTYILLKTGESWSRSAPLRYSRDYSWAFRDGTGAIRIAHALGAWKSDRRRNTLNALDQTLSRGFRIVEVDLALASDGNLHCFHGSDGRRVALPTAQIGQVCNYGELIERMRRQRFVLMLDLKSDFEQSAKVIVARTPASLRHRIVFQLYRPDDIATFNTLPDGFAGPVVTLYRTMRSVHHLRPELIRIGAKVVTVPLSRMDEFGGKRRPSGWILLTHPIEDCSTLAKIRRSGFAGGYMDNDLDCCSKSVSEAVAAESGSPIPGSRRRPTAARFPKRG